MSDAAVGWLTLLAMFAVAIVLVALAWRYQAYVLRDETPEDRGLRE
jgi:hypothetical protein